MILKNLVIILMVFAILLFSKNNQVNAQDMREETPKNQCFPIGKQTSRNIF